MHKRVCLAAGGSLLAATISLFGAAASASASTASPVVGYTYVNDNTATGEAVLALAEAAAPNRLIVAASRLPPAARQTRLCMSFSLGQWGVGLRWSHDPAPLGCRAVRLDAARPLAPQSRKARSRIRCARRSGQPFWLPAGQVAAACTGAVSPLSPRWLALLGGAPMPLPRRHREAQPHRARPPRGAGHHSQCGPAAPRPCGMLMPAPYVGVGRATFSPHASPRVTVSAGKGPPA